MLHSMPRGIFFVLLSSALQALNRPVVKIEVHVAPRYSNEEQCRAFARVGGNFRIPMHYGPGEDMNVLVCIHAKVPVFCTSIWSLQGRVFVDDFEQLLLDPVRDIGMLLEHFFCGSIRPIRGAFV